MGDPSDPSDVATGQQTASVGLVGPTDTPKAALGYGLRHDPTVIHAVAEHMESGLLDSQIAAIPGMPSTRSIERLVSETPDLAAIRACARRVFATDWAIEALAIVDAPLPEDPRFASAEATRAKSRADARFKMAGYWDRDTYGERPPVVAVQVNSTVVSAFGAMYRVQGE